MNLINNIANQYSLTELEPIKLIRESADNFVYSVGTKDRKILRISKRLPIEDVQFEFEIFDFLSGDNFPVPKWNKTKDGKTFSHLDGQIGVLFDFINGYHVKVDKDNLPNETEAYTGGKYLALFHNLGLDFKSASPRKRNIYSEFERVLSKRVLFENQFEGGKEFLEQVEEIISFAKKEKPIIGLIHGDLRADNVFFKNDSEINGFIDFDWSCIGPQIKDLALAIVEWSFPIPGRTEPDWKIFDAFLDGYNSVAKTKYEKGQILYFWIKFTTLSDASTYFCDIADDPNKAKKVLSSYMYKKYLFFDKLSGQ